jgi:hypothetical protein
MAKITPYEIISPPLSMLSHLKTAANNSALHTWVLENIANCDTLVMSSELFMYGGLIASRISNETKVPILVRFVELVAYKQKFPKLKIFISNVIMRIPAYNGDFEVCIR